MLIRLEQYCVTFTYQGEGLTVEWVQVTVEHTSSTSAKQYRKQRCFQRMLHYVLKPRYICLKSKSKTWVRATSICCSLWVYYRQCLLTWSMVVEVYTHTFWSSLDSFISGSFFIKIRVLVVVFVTMELFIVCSCVHAVQFLFVFMFQCCPYILGQ